MAPWSSGSGCTLIGTCSAPALRANLRASSQGAVGKRRSLAQTSSIGRPLLPSCCCGETERQYAGSAPKASRYSCGTRGLHLDNPEIVSVDVPALGGVMNDTARSLLNSWLLDYAREEPVYRLDDDTFGRIAARRIDRVAIESGLITLHLD